MAKKNEKKVIDTKEEKKRIKKDIKALNEETLADSLLQAAKVESILSATEDEFADIRDEGNEAARQKILQFVKMKEDLQKLRIATGNRVCASFNIQMGQKPGTKQSEMDDKENQKLIEKLRKEYKRITDAYAENRSSIKKVVKAMAPEMEFIKSKLDYDVVAQYISLLDVEEKNKDSLKTVVHEHPLWDAFFSDIKGLGEETAAVCIAYLDPYKARHASCFISFAGLNPVEVAELDDKGKEVLDENGLPKQRVIGNCKKYTVLRDYKTKDGKVAQKKSITYNPMVKTKLLGVAAPCIIKANIRNEKDADGNNTGMQLITGPYANAYLDYKRRQVAKGLSDIHAHNRALRYMMKQVLKDCWNVWRKLEGLPVTLPYEQEFLGRAPHKWPNLTVYNKKDDQIVSTDEIDFNED